MKTKITSRKLAAGDLLRADILVIKMKKKELYGKYGDGKYFLPIDKKILKRNFPNSVFKIEHIDRAFIRAIAL